jgi:hypothetical protein
MQEHVNNQRQYFNSNQTKDLNFRIKQLKKPTEYPFYFHLK